MAKFPVMVAATGAMSGVLNTLNMGASPLNGSWTVNAGFRDIPFSVATDVSDFYMNIGTAPGGSATRTLRIRKNAANDNISALFNSGDTSASDTTNTNSYSAGDRLDIACAIASSPASTSNNRWAFQTSAENQSLQASTANNASTTLTLYNGIQDSSGVATTATPATQVVVGSGTFRNLYCGLSSTIASGSYLVELYKNGSATGVQVTLDSSNQYKADTSNTVTYSEGDEFYYQITPSSPSAARAIKMSLENVADDAGTGMLLGSSGTALTSSTVYNTWYCSSKALFNATQSTREALALSHRAFRLYFQASAAPGATENRVIAYRVNGANSALSVTLVDSETTGVSAVDVDVNDLDLVVMRQRASAGAANAIVRYAVQYKVIETSTFTPKILMF